jgi:hypothetical protein
MNIVTNLLLQKGWQGVIFLDGLLEVSSPLVRAAVAISYQLSAIGFHLEWASW